MSSSVLPPPNCPRCGCRHWHNSWHTMYGVECWACGYQHPPVPARPPRVVDGWGMEVWGEAVTDTPRVEVRPSPMTYRIQNAWHRYSLGAFVLFVDKGWSGPREENPISDAAWLLSLGYGAERAGGDWWNTGNPGWPNKGDD